MIIDNGCLKTSPERLQRKQTLSMSQSKIMDDKLSEFIFYTTSRIIFSCNLALTSEQASDNDAARLKKTQF